MRIFKTPFARDGDRTAIDDSYNANGKLSYPSGFGADYQKNLATDPDAKNIERKNFNQLMFDITDTIFGIQKVGSQPWTEELKPYGKGSTIYHGGDTYINLADGNNNVPTGDINTGWASLSLIQKLANLDSFAKKNTAVLEESGRWICGDTNLAIQWGTLNSVVTGKTRAAGNTTFRWPFSVIFHIGATTATGWANSRSGYNTSISIDAYTNTSLNLAFETNGADKINISQKAFWFAIGILAE